MTSYPAGLLICRNKIKCFVCILICVGTDYFVSSATT